MVYQARVLHNSINNCYRLFQSNCTTASSARLGNTTAEVNNPIVVSKSIDVYPNPSNHSFNINLMEAGIEQANLKVYDVNGRLVLEQEVSASEKAIVEFNLNTSEGIYLLVLTDNMSETIYKQKLILQK